MTGCEPCSLSRQAEHLRVAAALSFSQRHLGRWVAATTSRWVLCLASLKSEFILLKESTAAWQGDGVISLSKGGKQSSESLPSLQRLCVGCGPAQWRVRVQQDHGALWKLGQVNSPIHPCS